MGTSIFTWNRKEDKKAFKTNNDSWRVDETYIKVTGEWKYFYRAVDSNGDTIDCILSTKRDRKASKRSFKKALGSNHNQMPRIITVDKNASYPIAINELKNEKKLSKNIEIRQVKYLNNIVEKITGL